MTKTQKLQERFFRKLGPGTAVFKDLLDTVPNVCFYIKDCKGRIIALNKRNCEVCNIANELDVVGKRSDEIFPAVLAQDYIARDREVLRTGRPILASVTPYPADRSEALMVSTVFPLRDVSGKLIGTACVYRLEEQGEANPDWYGRLKSVTAYIHSHYSEPISLDVLAKSVHISTSRFKSIFSKILGISPGKYIINARLNAARALLENSDKLITEIAVEVGFWDHSHFTKTFKQARGMTPHEYRKRHWKDSSFSSRVPRPDF